MHIHIEVVSTATGVLPNESLLISFVDSLLQTIGFVPELSSHINISSFCSHAEPNDECSFHQLVGIVSQYFSIFTGAWLRLITIDN